jgi:hypothetical protein
MFSVLSHKGNANQNDTESPVHPSPENKEQMLVRMWGKGPLHTAGVNVN